MNKTIIASIFLIASMLASWSVCADEPKPVKPEKTRLVVFPLEGIGMSLQVLDASSELLNSALLKQGYILGSWERGYKELTGFEPQDRLLDPATARVKDPHAELESGRPSAPVKDSSVNPDVNVVVNVITNENQPNEEAVAEPGTDTVVQNGQPQTEEKTAAVSEPTKEAPVRLTDNLKAEITKKLNCDYYVDGKVVKLGTKARVSLVLHNVDGDSIRAVEMESYNVDDLSTIYSRMAEALYWNKSIEETRTLDNATTAETAAESKSDRVRNFNGLTLGGGIAIDSAVAGSIRAMYDGIWEVRKVKAGIQAGLIYNTDQAFAVVGDVLISGYLSDGAIAPYIGGGAGIFLGVSDEYSSVGFEFFPMFGVEFLRNARMRFHVDLRYSLFVDIEPRVSHGPTMMFGIAFD